MLMLENHWTVVTHAAASGCKVCNFELRLQLTSTQMHINVLHGLNSRCSKYQKHRCHQHRWLGSMWCFTSLVSFYSEVGRCRTAGARPVALHTYHAQSPALMSENPDFFSNFILFFSVFSAWIRLYLLMYVPHLWYDKFDQNVLWHWVSKFDHSPSEKQSPKHCFQLLLRLLYFHFPSWSRAMQQGCDPTTTVWEMWRM